MIIIVSISAAFIAFFLYCWVKYSNPLFALVSGAWVANLAYELWTDYDCIGECTLGMDSYFIFPFLGIFTLMGLAGWLKSIKKGYEKRIVEDNSFKEVKE